MTAYIIRRVLGMITLLYQAVERLARWQPPVAVAGAVLVLALALVVFVSALV